MVWDKSDSDLEIEWDKSKKREYDAELITKKERNYQRSINNLKKIGHTEIKIIEKDGKKTHERIINYTMPKDFAGNTMTAPKRDQLKKDLIINITKDTE